MARLYIGAESPNQCVYCYKWKQLNGLGGIRTPDTVVRSHVL
jgi:hypothetical protein